MSSRDPIHARLIQEATGSDANPPDAIEGSEEVRSREVLELPEGKVVIALLTDGGIHLQGDTKAVEKAKQQLLTAAKARSTPQVTKPSRRRADRRTLARAPELSESES